MIITNLLTNMVIIARCDAALTNTQDFQQYAYKETVARISTMASSLGLSEAAAAEIDIKDVHVTPYPAYYATTVEMNDRYSFRLVNGGIITFADRVNCERFVFTKTNLAAFATTNEDREEAWLRAVESEEAKNENLARRWATATNLLDMSKARRIAESALRGFGVTAQETTLQHHPRAKQASWRKETGDVRLPFSSVKTDAAGNVIDSHGIPEHGKGSIGFHGPFADGSWIASYPLKHPLRILLPYYTFRWEAKDTNCEIDVSGITGNIVYLSYSPRHDWRPLPASYFQLIGLPANSVFVTRRLDNPMRYDQCEPTLKGGR